MLKRSELSGNFEVREWDNDAIRIDFELEKKGFFESDKRPDEVYFAFETFEDLDAYLNEIRKEAKKIYDSKKRSA